MIVLAVAMPTLIGIGAICLDMSSFYLVRDRLQISADAAATAGASKLPNTTDASSTCIAYAETNMATAIKTRVFWTSPTRHLPFPLLSSIVFRNGFAGRLYTILKIVGRDITNEWENITTAFAQRIGSRGGWAGPAKIGKSAVITQLEKGRLGATAVPVILSPEELVAEGGAPG